MNTRVPPESILMDGSTTATEFIENGAGFVHETLIKRCRLQPNERVLDLGCGLGQKARVLADYLDTNGRYEGLDIVPHAIEFCRAAYADDVRFRFKIADLRSSHYNPAGEHSAAHYRFPYEDRAFDLVFLCSLFTHLMPDELANYCREIHRVLKPSGRCVATCFLLNEETRTAIVQNWTNPSYRFRFAPKSSWFLDPENQSQGVAHDEQWIRRTFRAAELRICEVTYGRWSGNRDMLQSDHDIVLAVPLV